MNERCSGEPISFLRLERYALGELGAWERAQIDAHLAHCEVCSACFAGLVDDAHAPLRLPALPARRARATTWQRAARGLGVSALALGTAAALLLWLRPVPVPHASERSGQGIKGGELVLDLLRERGGDTALDPSHFTPGDRFAARVTCAPGPELAWDLVIFQGGVAYFPLQPTAALACGNHVGLPGAFTLDGESAASVCVALSEHSGIERSRLRRLGPAGLPARSACRLVAPATP